MSLEDAISGAISDAREEGIVDDPTPGESGDGEEVAPDAGEETPDAGEGEAVVEGEAKPVEGDVKPEAKVEVKAEEKPAEEKAEEEVVQAKDARGRENKIPYSRHVKITENAVKKAFAPIAAALGGKPEEFKPEAVIARLARATELEGIQAKDDGIKQLIDRDPDMFIHQLAQHHPGYRKFAALLDGKVAEKPAQKTEVAVAGDEPEPDIEFKDADGNVTGTTYSLAGMKKRDAWRDAKLRESILQELKPLRDDHQARANEAALEPVLKAQIAEAATWKDWAVVEKDVEAVLVADANQAQKTGKFGHNLRSAYLQVMNDRLEKAVGEATAKATEAATVARKKVVDELKRKPASTSAKTTDGKGEEQSGPRDLMDVIRGEVAKVKGSRA